MVAKSFITWSEYDLYIDRIADWVKYKCEEDIGAIYGLPRGGLPIAVSLSHRLDLPLQYDWTPTLEQCGSLLSVYLDKPRQDIWCKDVVVIRTPKSPFGSKDGEV